MCPAFCWLQSVYVPWASSQPSELDSEPPLSSTSSSSLTLLIDYDKLKLPCSPLLIAQTCPAALIHPCLSSICLQVSPHVYTPIAYLNIWCMDVCVSHSRSSLMPFRLYDHVPIDDDEGSTFSPSSAATSHFSLPNFKASLDAHKRVTFTPSSICAQV